MLIAVIECGEQRQGSDWRRALRCDRDCRSDYEAGWVNVNAYRLKQVQKKVRKQNHTTMKDCTLNNGWVSNSTKENIIVQIDN